MARSFAGGTDRVSYTDVMANMGGPTTVAFRFKTTQATANVQLFGRWNGSSRNGFAVLLNTTANKLQYVAYGGTSPTVDFTGTTTVNDGTWHSIIILANNLNAAANSFYIDGVSQGSANSSAAWNCLGSNYDMFGDSADTFWATYVGEIADHGHWDGIHLDATEIAAFTSGISARQIRPASLTACAPMVRDYRCLRGNSSPSVVGTTVTDHPRVIGSMV